MFAGLLLAAGRGRRFDGEKPKQFVELNGHPVIEHSVRLFEQTPEMAAYGILTLPEWQSRLQTIISDLSADKCKFVSPGGQTRRESVAVGLQELHDCLARQPRVVAVHDSARPAVPGSHLLQLLESFEQTKSNVKGVIPGLPVRDTIKRVRLADDSAYVRETLPREQLRRVQTPQLFDFNFLFHIHEKWAGPEPTDDAMMVEQNGGEVVVIPGLRENVKLTFPEDLELLKDNLLKLKQNGDLDAN